MPPVGAPLLRVSARQAIAPNRRAGEPAEVAPHGRYALSYCLLPAAAWVMPAIMMHHLLCFALAVAKPPACMFAPVSSALRPAFLSCMVQPLPLRPSVSGVRAPDLGPFSAIVNLRSITRRTRRA